MEVRSFGEFSRIMRASEGDILEAVKVVRLRPRMP